MNLKICKNCIHYLQHYIIDAQCCTSINCGHCTHPRLKHREPGTKACQHFELSAIPPALPDREHVIHFLTTELLQYILSLVLPPEQTGK